ncbi:unnamed protein product [Adineta steineri]|uniref:Translin-associated factor X-interacting protein 1 N-terminal domain-containing protein n=1 Tax=Adineta steineri TaxID=433720 RepID=A0A815M8R6_9BILA|nr:unnamed protein product [Adineta steineri]CAF1618236.1 unnamed protein product [Adineta steineri]
MSSQLKEICNTIYREQIQSIKDLTSGHLNENHLYHPPNTIDGKRKPTWSSSQKPHPTLRPSHRLKTYSSNIEHMKDSLVDFTYLSLPELPKKQSQKSPRLDEQQSLSPSSSITCEQLPPITNERFQVPTFSIDISEEQRVRKLKTFNDTVIQTKDVNLHGLGYSEDFVASVEQTLLMKLSAIDSQHKGQTISLTRLQAYGEALNQLTEGSVAFGPALERIKDEYDFYLDHLLISQPEYGTHIAEQLKRLRQAQPKFSTTNPKLFDVDKVEEQARRAIERNRQLNEELKRVKREQIRIQDEAPARIFALSNTSKEIKVKTQVELVDDLRQNIFDLLDQLTRKKQELNEKFVHKSVCTQLQEIIRDTQMIVIKTNKENEKLLIELDKLEEKIKQEIISNDQSEFTEEHVQQIVQLLKKFDILHMKNSISGDDDTQIDNSNFLHTYDDYFS